MRLGQASRIGLTLGWEIGIIMKLKLDRIISIATLVASVAAIALVLKKPAPTVQPQAPAVAEHSQPSEQKTAQSQTGQAEPSPASNTSATFQPQASQSQSMPSQTQVSPAPASSPAQSSTPAANASSDAISAMLAKSLGAGTSALTPDSNAGSGEPNIKDQQVTYEGDVVHGRFLTEIGGKDVWVTISGHMGEKDGYATFDPTEFKVGDKEVPVSLVNPLLQQRLAQERDRMKIPDSTPK